MLKFFYKKQNKIIKNRILLKILVHLCNEIYTACIIFNIIIYFILFCRKLRHFHCKIYIKFICLRNIT